MNGGKARRISQDTALESDPAFSPDGHLLAFVRTERGEDLVRLLDLATGQTRLLTSGPGISQLAWSSDGRRLVAMVTIGFDQYVTVFNLADGTHEQLAEAGLWSPRPQFSADGHALYYSMEADGVGNLFRLALAKGSKLQQANERRNSLPTPDESAASATQGPGQPRSAHLWLSCRLVSRRISDGAG
jgi:Tol biopolymer transport system component